MPGLRTFAVWKPVLLAPKVIDGSRSTFFSWTLLCVLLSMVSASCAPKVTVLLEPAIAPVDCVCVMLDVCVFAFAATLSRPAATLSRPTAEAAAAAPAGAFATATALTGSLCIALTTLTSQHLVTTQVATTGQQHVTGAGQQQDAAVVQLVH